MISVLRRRMCAYMCGPKDKEMHEPLSKFDSFVQIDRQMCLSLQRFIPSEFGADPDRIQISDMDYNFYLRKAEIRRLVEAEGIPYTYISCNFLMSYLLPSLVQPGLKTPPRDKIRVFGDGNVKGLLAKIITYLYMFYLAK